MLKPFDSVMTASVEKVVSLLEESETGKKPAKEAETTSVNCSISSLKDFRVS